MEEDISNYFDIFEEFSQELIDECRDDCGNAEKEIEWSYI